MPNLLQVQEAECRATEPTLFTEYPWQQVATDLFEWKKTSYILVVDYSCYIEIATLRTTNGSSGVIQKLKTVFA